MSPSAPGPPPPGGTRGEVRKLDPLQRDGLELRRPHAALRRDHPGRGGLLGGGGGGGDALALRPGGLRLRRAGAGRGGRLLPGCPGAQPLRDALGRRLGPGRRCERGAGAAGAGHRAQPRRLRGRLLHAPLQNAHRLEGELLLIWGELDTNVDPSSSMQVVDALVEADKHFDMLVIPGGDHGAGRCGPTRAYGDLKRNDFFVKHLLGVEPPRRNRVG